MAVRDCKQNLQDVASEMKVCQLTCFLYDAGLEARTTGKQKHLPSLMCTDNISSHVLLLS